nr:cytochrome c oxidase subunit 3 [Hydroides norvegica]
MPNQLLPSGDSKFMSPWPRYLPSLWPICSAFAVGQVLLSLCLWFHEATIYLFAFSFLVGLLCAMGWVRELIVEGTFLGMYTSHTHKSLKCAMILFIVSEAMFFFSFFWAYCHYGFAPGFFLGCRWPPVGITPIHPVGLPFMNLVILLSSSVTINLAHGYLRVGNPLMCGVWLSSTLVLGVCFFCAQLKEYYWAKFTVTDGVWGSSFFMLTGLHGFHVLLGMGFMVFNLVRLSLCQFHTGENISFISMLWYWHFVDFIWVIIWPLVYVWGGWGYFHYSLSSLMEIKINPHWGQS